MRDLESRFAEFAGDVDARGLTDAADLRRGADRRARRRMAVLVSAGVVVVAAAGAGVFRGATAPPDPIVPPPVTPTPSFSPSPTPGPSRTSAPPTSPSVSSVPPTITSIPGRAFFAIPSERRTVHAAVNKPADFPVTKFCADPLADDSTVTARRVRESYYQSPSQVDDNAIEGVVVQAISAYGPGRAAKAMDRLRSELNGCDSYESEGITYTLETLNPPDDGDEAILVERRSEWSQGNDSDYLLAIRVGDIVTVVSDSVFEIGEADPDDVRLFGGLAVETIEDWR
ncbi:hypothetical protein Ais01nite_71290 [Asanoa ishikariensis]|uniref:PknH-like extracellular domain-containing protein n=1 Tax=Asanoa ishikariensis TaxID=137265 RepID=A0A1H3UNS8_9ACTN|nr:hypothetical protein [Asanoa ishikariensis]GIF69094.1 hypothetical protein Ais01nite_71290 [Asanoa ishikariensis]SDZ64090.1 hypothetical protein SAMN05421684_7664 [Asanoa ishikariensis]